MLNYQANRFTHTDQSPVATGELIGAEGMALVFTRENGQAVVSPASGVNGEIFAGFSYERTNRPDVLPAVVEGVASDSAELGRKPIAGQLAVFVDGDKRGVEIGADAPADATKVMLNGTTLSFHADDAGKEFVARMLFSPSVAEARAMQGEGNDFTNSPASAEVGVVGRILGGIVSTDQFDVHADWNDESVMHPSLGADGRLTIGGSGTELTNLVIRTAPSSESSFLTVEFI